tara:strand:- start:1635 stop:2843 length:1209 start_codon:yes stop_codon:yes gene_type:complete
VWSNAPDVELMHIHLDLVGGISGDMFIGALLDCFPERKERLPEIMEAAGFADLVDLQHEVTGDGILTGTHFKVMAGAQAEGHDHRHYSDIRQKITDSSLDDATKRVALGIFQLIAEAEAKIHGKDIDQVAFHEVGAWDSIADIVCAASLISSIGVSSWSVSRLPLGRGQVKTAHGRLPVPAPATSLLLEGFDFFDDGIEGERITPTGAAILKYLDPAPGIPEGANLKCSGYGFGTRKFPGISNVLRLLVFNRVQSGGWDSDQVLQLEFEVDDQTPEELAVALEKIRAMEGVIDVIQAAVFAKKGRQSTTIRVLARPEIEQLLTEYCFNVTSTLGIRHQLTARSILRRSQFTINHEGKDYRVKVATRPGGLTAKVEMDDLLVDTDIRQLLEGLALEKFRETDE